MPFEPDGDVPADPEIRGLVAVHGAGLAAVLAAAGVDGGHGPVQVLKHHHGERCTFRAFAGKRPVIVKAIRGPLGPAIELYEALEAAGLASGSPPTTAPLLGCAPDLGVMVHAELDGPTGTDLIASGLGEGAGVLAAGWLHGSWGSGVTVGERRSVGDVVRDGERWAAVIAAHDTRLGDHAALVVESLAHTQPADGAAVLVHGSLYPGHLFDLRGGPGVIDLDTAHQGRREYDVGMFLAVVRKSNLARRKAPASATRAVATLLDRVGPRVEAAAVHWYEAAFVVKFASYLAKKAKPDSRARVRDLLGEALALAQGVTPPALP